MKYFAFACLLYSSMSFAMAVRFFPPEETFKVIKQLSDESTMDSVSKLALNQVWLCEEDGAHIITNDEVLEKLKYMDMLDASGKRVHIQHIANLAHLRIPRNQN
ncbi:MAG TPA: hypothetical protein VHO47_05475 [Candidatus Babeliales bacterium]|nr:hypothetical protein [Candidatus Babeliales bacterium]